MLCIIYINLPMYKTAILKKPLNSIMKDPFRKVWFQFQPHVQVRGAAKAACRLRVVVTVVSWQGSSFMVQDCFWEHV